MFLCVIQNFLEGTSLREKKEKEKLQMCAIYVD